MKTQLWIFVVTLPLLTACGRYHSAQDVADSALQNLGCKAAQSEMWESFHKIVEQNDSFPSAAAVADALAQAGAAKGMRGSAFKNYVTAFVNNYTTTVDGIKSHFAPQDRDGWKKALAEMEVGIRVTSVHADLQDRIQGSMRQLTLAAHALDATCGANEGRQPAGEMDPLSQGNRNFTNLWDQLASVENPEVVGLQRTFATAYQSCDVLQVPALTAATPAVSGILDQGEGSRPGGGHLRKISNLANLLSTDPYYHGPTPAKSSCFNVRQDPLIYNYGGKPYTTSSQPQLLDLFTHVSTGGPTLGIDCSGFVFTSLAIAGLKMDPDPAKPLKADLVWGIPSTAFMNPQNNGLRCLDKITLTAAMSVAPGDIIAINGHVFMIESTGADPFGLHNASSLADCAGEKISSANFDFVIGQSAATKNGIGINFFRINDYANEDSTIKNGLVAYARAACRAKFGAAPALSSPNLSIVRHKRTPECTTTPLQLAHADCTDSCQAR